MEYWKIGFIVIFSCVGIMSLLIYEAKIRPETFEDYLKEVRCQLLLKNIHPLSIDEALKDVYWRDCWEAGTHYRSATNVYYEAFFKKTELKS